MSNVLIVIPTYDERDNLSRIVARIRAAVPAAHMLVVDDDSPDGTGRIADRLASEAARRARPAPRAEAGARCRVLGGLPLGARPRVRAAGGDRRRRLAPARAAARAAARGGAGRPRHRLALDARRPGGELAAPHGSCSRAWPTGTPGSRSGCPSPTSPAGSASTAPPRSPGSCSAASSRAATASRWISPCGPCARAARWRRCRSPSSTVRPGRAR